MLKFSNFAVNGEKPPKNFVTVFILLLFFRIIPIIFNQYAGTKYFILKSLLSLQKFALQSSFAYKFFEVQWLRVNFETVLIRSADPYKFSFWKCPNTLYVRTINANLYCLAYFEGKSWSHQHYVSAVSAQSWNPSSKWTVFSAWINKVMVHLPVLEII